MLNFLLFYDKLILGDIMNKGFTLVELIAVIALLAILVIITTPVYKLIAKNRKKLNKRFQNCPYYPPETRARFLDL